MSPAILIVLGARDASNQIHPPNPSIWLGRRKQRHRFSLSVDGKRGGSLSGDGSVGNPVIAERLSNEILYSSKKGERVVKQERFENGDVDNKVDPKTEKYSFECGKRSQADYLQFALVLSTYMPRAVQRRRQLFCDL